MSYEQIMYRLNTKLLSAMVRSQRGSLSLRAASAQIGNVSTSTLSRIENGSEPDMMSFLSICDWLNYSPSLLIEDDSSDSRPAAVGLSAPEKIAMILLSDEQLNPATANALARIIRTAYPELLKQ